jgi:hypothetical protein
LDLDYSIENKNNNNVSEPITVLLLGLGLAGVAGIRHFKN